MVGIDVVEVNIRRLWAWFARHRRDMGGDPGAAGEGHDRRAAIAAELVGRGADAAQCAGNRPPAQCRQHRVRGRALPVARDEDRYLLGGQTALGRLPPRLRDLLDRPARLPLKDSRMNVSSPSTIPAELCRRMGDGWMRKAAYRGG